MTTKRHRASFGLLVASTLLLSACGRDPVPPPEQRPSEATPGVVCGGEKQLTAEGSSAQTNAFAQFTSAFVWQCQENNIDYNPTGSGSGVRQFTAGQVDIGGSDSPLEEEEIPAAAQRCDGHPAAHLPLVFGPIAVAHNVTGVSDLALTPEVIARIFNGEIRTWDDPAIAALNPGARLPSAEINVFYRNDDSGTTDNFQKYLGAAAGEAWPQGDGKSFKGGVGEGKAKSQGVADAVSSTPNSITYVEASYADNSGLDIARIDSGSGPVALDERSAATAIEHAEVLPGRPDDLVLDIESLYASNIPGAYPLMMVTYELVCPAAGYSPDTARAVTAFLRVAAGSGQQRLSDAGYIPLPDAFRDKVNAAIDSLS